MPDDETLYTRLIHYLSSKAISRKGEKYLLELLSHPDQRIHSSQLRNLYNLPGKSAGELQTLSLPESALAGIELGYTEQPIPITDHQTLDACKKRLRRLNELLEQKSEWNDDAAVDELLTEKQTLVDYLLSCLTSTGEIKSLLDQSHADYRALLQAINRCKEQIALEQPDLLPYISQHLVIGIYCIWSATPKSR